MAARVRPQKFSAAKRMRALSGAMPCHEKSPLNPDPCNVSDISEREEKIEYKMRGGSNNLEMSKTGKMCFHAVAMICRESYDDQSRNLVNVIRKSVSFRHF